MIQNETTHYLFKQLQAVRIVIIREENHTGVPFAPVLPEPRQSRVPLLGGAWHPGALEPPGSEHMQMGERHAAPGQESRHQVGAHSRVLHYDPVEARQLAESVGESGELRFLHRTGVSRRDGVDNWQGRLVLGATCPRCAGSDGPLRLAGPTGCRRPDRPFTVDINHNDDNKDPGQQDEEAAEKHRFHGEYEVTVRAVFLTPSQTERQRAADRNSNNLFF